METENPRKKLYRFLITDPESKGTFSKYGFPQFEAKIANEPEGFDDIANFAIEKGFAKDLESFYAAYTPPQATPPAKPVGVLAPPRPQSLSSVTATQASGRPIDVVERPVEEPMFMPKQFQNQAEIEQSALSPVFKDNAQALQTQILPTKDAESDFQSLPQDQQQAAIQGGTGAELSRKRSPKPDPSILEKVKSYGSDIAKSIERGWKQGEAIQTNSLTDMATGNVEGIDFETMAKANKEVRDVGQTAIEQDFAQSDGLWDDITDYAKMALPVMAESVVTLLRSGAEEVATAGATGAAMGSVIPGAGTLAGGATGAMAGTAMAGYNMELYASIMDELESVGVDVSDAKQLKAAFSDKKLMGPILTKANTRAAIIMGVDLIGGSAGNAASKAISAARPLTKTGRAFQKIANKASLLDEVATGSGGEAAAQYVTTGEVNTQDVYLEGLGGAPIVGAFGKLDKVATPKKGAASGQQIAQQIISDKVKEAKGEAPTQSETTYVAVTPEELQAYQDGTLQDPDRLAGIADDVAKGVTPESQKDQLYGQMLSLAYERQGQGTENPTGQNKEVVGGAVEEATTKLNATISGLKSRGYDVEITDKEQDEDILDNKDNFQASSSTVKITKNGEYVGSITLAMNFEGYQGVTIAVDQNHRNQGLSKELYALAIAKAKEKGMKGVFSVDEALQTPEKTKSTRKNFNITEVTPEQNPKMIKDIGRHMGKAIGKVYLMDFKADQSQTPQPITLNSDPNLNTTEDQVDEVEVMAPTIQPLEITVSGSGNAFVPALQKLGYTDEEISGMTMDQQQEIAINKTEPSRAESSSKVDVIKENAKQEKIAEMQAQLDEVATETIPEAGEGNEPTTITPPTPKKQEGDSQENSSLEKEKTPMRYYISKGIDEVQYTLRVFDEEKGDSHLQNLSTDLEKAKAKAKEITGQDIDFDEGSLGRDYKKSDSKSKATGDEEPIEYKDNFRFKSGKHQDKTPLEVFEIDKGFFDWFLKNWTDKPLVNSIKKVPKVAEYLAEKEVQDQEKANKEAEKANVLKNATTISGVEFDKSGVAKSVPVKGKVIRVIQGQKEDVSYGSSVYVAPVVRLESGEEIILFSSNSAKFKTESLPENLNKPEDELTRQELRDKRKFETMVDVGDELAFNADVEKTDRGFKVKGRLSKYKPSNTTPQTPDAKVEPSPQKPIVSETKEEGKPNPFISKVRKSFQSALTKLGLKANVEFISDKEAEGIVSSGKPIKMMLNGKEQTVIPQPEVTNGFYSPLEKVINETKFDKLPAKQWIDKFAKGDEAKWTGLTEWLGQQPGAVSKADIQNYLRNNRIEVVEVVKGEETKPKGLKRFDEIVNILNSRGYDVDIEDYGGPDMGIRGVDKGTTFLEERNGGFTNEELISDGYVLKETHNEDVELLEEAQKEASKIRRLQEKEDNLQGTKFSQYQLEGEKENYKEVLVTMPSRVAKPTDKVDYYAQRAGSYEAWKALPSDQRDEIFRDWLKIQEKELAEQSKQFHSTHFDEPNILVHLRMNTRTDSEGNKVLFLEEVQSDWGQQGKKKGFVKEIEKTKWNDPKDVNGNKVYKSEKGDYVIIDRGSGNISLLNSEGEDIFDGNYKTVDEAKNAVEKEAARFGQKGTLTAPFVTDTNAWTKLGLKFALKESVAQGADKIAWTTGEQQNERYSLEKVADEVRYSKNADGTYRVIAYKNGENVSEDKALKEDKLETTLGKEVAQRIIDGVGEDIEGQKSLTGENLKVGGKGMKGFYGSPTEGSLGIVGNVAKSLFKQEPGTISFDTGNAKIDAVKYDGSQDISDMPGSYYLKEGDWLIKDLDGSFVWYEDGSQSKADAIQSFKEAAEGADNVISEGKGIQTQHSITITPELKAQATEGQPLFMKNTQGTILGFVQPQPDGSYKVWIDPKTTDAETPIHELAGHIFMPLLKEAAPELHNRGIELIQNTPYLKAAEALGLEGDAASEEALAQAIGEKGKQLSETKRKGFVEWLNGMWQKVGDALGITKPIKDLTLGEFTDLIAGTVLFGGEFEMKGEQGRKARAALKESVGKDKFKVMEKIAKDSEKIFRGLEGQKLVEIVCP
jgi:GNAT superfamily N-acetyltransferase